MRHLIILLTVISVFITVSLWAHPGIGIVKDHRGFVFYTDLEQVWQIDPQGNRSIAVTHVHTHELAIDSEGNLIGEEVRSAGGSWQHRIWRRAPDGQMSEVARWADGFWQESGLTTDGAGNNYWVSCPEKRCAIRRKEPSGRTTVLARDSQFHYAINWLAVDRDGAVYFLDGPDLRRVDATGKLLTVAADLGPSGNQNALMGLHLSSDGAIYVAVPSRRAVLKVTAFGQSSVAVASPAPWAPSGVLLDTDGSIWLLEFNTENRFRVRRIQRNGAVRIY